MSQSAVAQIERPGIHNRRQTLEKIANALNLDVQQLMRQGRGLKIRAGGLNQMRREKGQR